MKIIKMILHLVSIVCLVEIIMSENPLWAVGLLGFSSLRLGIMIGEKGTKSSK